MKVWKLRLKLFTLTGLMLVFGWFWLLAAIGMGLATLWTDTRHALRKEKAHIDYGRRH